MYSTNNSFILKRILPVFVVMVSLVLLIVPMLTLAVDDEDVDDSITVTSYASDELPFDPYVGSNVEEDNQTDGSLGPVMSSILTVDLQTADPLTVTFTLINTGLSFLGLAFLVLLLYAGALWMLAQGNEEQVSKAKKILIRSSIGMLVSLAALSISMTLFTIINDTIDQETGTEETWVHDTGIA